MKRIISAQPASHRGHRLSHNVRQGNYAGRRLETDIVRCHNCGGPISVNQIQVKRAH